MKRILYITTALAFLIAPVLVHAEDAGPATKPTVAQPAVVQPKKVDLKPASAIQPTTKVPSQPVTKSTIHVEGKVEVSEAKTKVTAAAPSSQPIAPLATPAPPASASEVGFAMTDIIVAFKTGKVWYGISLLLMLLTFVLGLVKKDIPPHALPWIAAALGMAGNAVAAVVGGMVWWEAVIGGLFQGAAAAGFWSMIGKHIFMSTDMKKKRANAREAVNGVKVSGEVDTEKKDG